jgi:hypothetical protein
VSGPSAVCPTCGEPWIGGPGCTTTVCAWTCGDPDHGQGDCVEACWNPLGLAVQPPSNRR